MERNTIKQGDSFDIVPDMQTESVDCIITSPPYWGLRDYELGAHLGLEDQVDKYVRNIANICDKLQRVLKPDGNLFLNLGDTYNTDSIIRKESSDRKIRADDERYIGVYANHEIRSMRRRTAIDDVPKRSKLFVPHRIAIELTEREWIGRNDIPWIKPAGGLDSATDRFRNRFEYFFLFTKTTDNFWQPDKALYDVFEERPSRSNGHPASFPAELIRPLIRAGCPTDGVVLDPFCGSGTTCMAAKSLGRDYIGVELKPEYVGLARNRVAEIPDKRVTSYCKENQ